MREGRERYFGREGRESEVHCFFLFPSPSFEIWGLEVGALGTGLLILAISSYPSLFPFSVSLLYIDNEDMIS